MKWYDKRTLTLDSQIYISLDQCKRLNKIVSKIAAKPLKYMIRLKDIYYNIANDYNIKTLV